MDSLPAGVNNPNTFLNDIKSDMADHAEHGSHGYTNELSKEDQDNLANFLSKVQG